MSSYLTALTVEDYVSHAFDVKEGGMFPGAQSPHARADADTVRRMKAGGQLPTESISRARLVPVDAGKIFVRWCSSGAHDFAAAAGGKWWSSDNIADQIVRLTRKKLGPDGDSGRIAREISAVGYDWSDLRQVVVVRTKVPIKVLIGFGRPVKSIDPRTGVAATLGDGKDLQCVILTSWQNQFRGDELFEPLFLRSSNEFTRWWSEQNLVGQRRAATIARSR
ncbi:MAG: hypothetical protein QOI66_5279 [Myxococcales bacterium]|nr:hypothetical protein [Myxococcales bacterium]